MLVVEGWTENVRAGKFRRRGREEAATAEAATAEAVTASGLFAAADARRLRSAEAAAAKAAAAEAATAEAYRHRMTVRITAPPDLTIRIVSSYREAAKPYRELHGPG